MHRSSTVAALLFAAMLTSAGCGDDDPITAPTPPSPVVEAIEGTLTPFSARVHPFQVQNAGTVIATLTVITPDTAIVGLDLGTWTGTFCQINVARPSTSIGLAVTGTATVAGSLCIRIYDIEPAGLPASVDYVVTVNHF